MRAKARAAQSETFPNRKEAQQWAQSIETAIREGRHLPHAAAWRTSFDAHARDCSETVLAEFDEKEWATRTRQLNWWAQQFAGLALAEITADAISQAGDRLAGETCTRGEPRKDRKTGETIAPKEYERSAGTVNRYIACLSHVLSFAVKERRLLDRLASTTSFGRDIHFSRVLHPPRRSTFGEPGAVGASSLLFRVSSLPLLARALPASGVAWGGLAPCSQSWYYRSQYGN